MTERFLCDGSRDLQMLPDFRECCMDSGHGVVDGDMTALWNEPVPATVSQP